MPLLHAPAPPPFPQLQLEAHPGFEVGAPSAVEVAGMKQREHEIEVGRVAA